VKPGIRWLILIVICGGFAGGLASLFLQALALATNFRELYPWLLTGLPMVRFIIFKLYRHTRACYFVTSTYTHLVGGCRPEERAPLCK